MQAPTCLLIGFTHNTRVVPLCRGALGQRSTVTRYKGVSPNGDAHTPNLQNRNAFFTSKSALCSEMLAEDAFALVYNFFLVSTARASTSVSVAAKLSQRPVMPNRCESTNAMGTMSTNPRRRAMAKPLPARPTAL